MSRLDWLHVALGATLILAFALLFGPSAGALVTGIITVALTKALLVWVRTNLRYPTAPQRLLVPYLLTGALLMFHVGEEALFGFGPRIAGIVGSPWTHEGFVSSFVFFMPLFWLSGAVGVALRHPFGGFMAWFLFIGMVVGEPTHLLVFPLLEGGRYAYFPGMWTALLPMLPALWGIVVMVRDSRAQRAASGAGGIGATAAR